MKEKYFALILKQEQGWFDSNNAYAFATKVQAHIEQIEMGLGEKFGLILRMTSQLISGLVIAFTSCFLKDPCILLLDEATSALDKESEIEVQKSINELQKNRTSISVAHV